MEKEMGIDRKYGKVTTEFGNIGETEPVVVFRAQDKILPKLLAYYHLFCLKAGSPRRHLDIILNTLAVIEDWQNRHSTKIPTSESSKDRLKF
jgi:hypothetical protein